MFIIFMALAIGPVVASSKLYSVVNTLDNISFLSNFGLVQPYNQSNNDTMGFNVTGTGAAAASATGGAAASTAASAATARLVKLF